ncbi:MAG: 23S rRNA (uridine(2552)-2'-O)-methyltransferase RlmE [Gammaproteobacteria bacterium]|jgi:23S rRNA (uridine2552-2'-O)-methyltransferase|nr:23S rRNA (uridine(2552)-2'-O)-methyltransferase RlmE [Gammaproteobacteria bacterium]MDG2338340.1 23S rRNA (uridine(2552)-2'-O)-methyltransferase RlmE [Gammaproteobacteria bacterium]
MARSKTSKQWLKEHFDDVYVRRAQEEGYRSRASFKLLEIQEQDRLIKRGMTVVDLGAAPGGWSQVAANLVGDKGQVIASDILPIDSLPDVEFLQGDFTEQAVLDSLIKLLKDEHADLVISDMAPNMSGMRDIDIPQVMYLAELALDLARTVLKPEGSFLAKVFHGEGYEELQKQLKSSFTSLKVRKPKASRARSSEIYLLASGFRGLN